MKNLQDKLANINRAKESTPSVSKPVIQEAVVKKRIGRPTYKNDAVTYARIFADVPTELKDRMVVALVQEYKGQFSTMSELDTTALYGCNIELQDASTGLIEKCVLKSEESTLQFTLSPEKKYRLIVSHEGFLPMFLDLEQAPSDFCQPLTKQVLLKPMRQ